MPKLNEKLVRVATHPTGTGIIPHTISDGNRLYLQISPTGYKSWLLQFELAGKRDKYVLGSLDNVSLTQARQMAKEADELIRQGKNPKLEAKRAKTANIKAKTFQEVAEAYVVKESGAVTIRTTKQWRSTLEIYVYPIIGTLPIASVNVDMILSILEPIWTTKHPTAVDIQERLERIFNYAESNDWITKHPARWVANLEEKLKRIKYETTHRLMLPYEQVSELITSLHKEQSVIALALEFVILTVSRAVEVLGATWQEFDLVNKTWTIPASRMKEGKEHIVPLSDQALQVLEHAKEFTVNELVFPGRAKNVQDRKNFARLLTDLGYGDKANAHGFRASFRTWAEQTDNYNYNAVEMCLSHSIAKGLQARAYQRNTLLDQRRIILQDWSNYVSQ